MRLNARMHSGAPIVMEVNTMEKYRQALKSFIVDNCSRMMREPQGMLKHPYTVPSSPEGGYYAMSLWDWDSWLISIVLGQVEADTGDVGKYLEYERGCVRNFLDNCDADGVIPINMTHEGPMERRLPGRGPFEDNMHKPVLAQHAAALCQRDGGRIDWIKPYFSKLEAFLNRYLTSHVHQGTGLAYWQDDFAVGVDNDPSVYYRPDKSCGSIYLNCLLYRELLSMGYLWEMADDLRTANQWRGKAQDLADAINRHCWDERDGTYYSVDFALREIDPNDWLHRGKPRHWTYLLLRIDNWSSFLPLWAGIAGPEQAARMVQRFLDPRTFNSKGGIRTLSKLEKMYDIRASNNPSNWLGPVWGISNFLMFSGLLKYGYETEARELAEKTIALFGRDLELNGSLHEYYNPDTCEPIVTRGFQKWDFLVLNMIAWLEGRKYTETF